MRRSSIDEPDHVSAARTRYRSNRRQPSSGLLGDVPVAVWELRVVPWRVAYAVEGRVVHVLHVFRKDQETTDDALS